MNQSQENADKLQASAVFVDWISENSLEWAKGGQVPARTKVRESEEFASLEHQSNFAEQLPYVRFEPAVPGVREISENVLFTAVNSAILLRQDPRSALRQAVRRANPLLERNKQKYG